MQKTQSSHPFVGIFLAYALGIILSLWLALSWKILVCSLLLLFLILIIFRRYSRVWGVVFLMVLILLGLLRVHVFSFHNKQDVTRFAYRCYKQPCLIEGVICSDVEKRSHGKSEKSVFVMRVNKVFWKNKWHVVDGKVYANIFNPIPLQYGRTIQAEGKLFRPFDFSEGIFSYKEFLKRRGMEFIFSVKKTGKISVVKSSRSLLSAESLFQLRWKLRGVLNEYFTYKEAGILQAILLGDRSQVTKWVRALFVETGTAHVLAISGLHMGIFAGICFLLLQMTFLPRRIQIIVVLCLVWAYVILTGSRISVVRSAIMISVFIGAFLVEREQDSLNTLFLAAFITLVINPKFLFDAGFQLSYLCVFSIIMINPLINRIFVPFKSKKQLGKMNVSQGIGDYIWDSLSISLSVWIGILGISVYYFQIFSPISIIANIFVVPLLSLIIAVGHGVMWSGLFCPIVAYYLSWSLKVLINLMVSVVYLFHSIPLAFTKLPQISKQMVSIYYVILFISIAFVYRKMRNTGN